MNLKKTLFAVGSCLCLLVVPSLRAQNGCVDSPEDPSIVLALVGGTAALVAGLRARKN